MSGFWQGTEQNTTGEAEIGGGEPIPAGTTLLAIIEEAKWGSANPDNDDFDPDEPEFVELKWSVIEGEYTGRVVYQKLRVLEDRRGAKHRDALAAIDFNCGGQLFKSPDMPSDESLAIALTNKAPMNIKVEVYDFNGKEGNWVCNVSGNDGQSASQQVLQETVQQHDPAAKTVQQEIDELEAAEAATAETPAQKLARLRAGQGATRTEKKF